MLKLKNCVKAGNKFNTNFMGHGKNAWKRPEQIPGYHEVTNATQSITWDDCVSFTGLKADDCFNEPLGTYVVFEQHKLRIMLIFIQGGSNTPIHDHEGMVVFCKCLKGGVGVDYWDYQNLDHVQNNIQNQDYDNLKHNGVKVNYNGSKDLKEGQLDVVKPFKNNLHRFRPEKNCIILDVIINDYDSLRPHKGYIQKADDLLQLKSVNRVSI